MKFIRTALVLAAACAAVSVQAETILQPINVPQQQPANKSANKSANKPAQPAQAVRPTASSDALTGKKEAAYVCQGGDRQSVKLTAMYGLQGNEVVVAQVKVGGHISPGMWLAANTPMNRFVSTDTGVRQTMWTTQPADANQITRVDGGKLSFAEKAGGTHTIIVENCKLDKAETARLNR